MRGRVVRGAGSPQLGHVRIGRAGMGVPPGVVVGAVAALAASIDPPFGERLRAQADWIDWS